jgi:hypothetical protein
LDSLERSASNLLSSDCKFGNRTEGRGRLFTLRRSFIRLPASRPLYRHPFLFRVSAIKAWSRVSSMSCTADSLMSRIGQEPVKCPICFPLPFQSKDSVIYTTFEEQWESNYVFKVDQLVTLLLRKWP